MADLILIDGTGNVVASVSDWTLDLAYGSGQTSGEGNTSSTTESENSFTLQLPDRWTPSTGWRWGVDGTQLGGWVDGTHVVKKNGVTTLTLTGRTWHGMLASRILQPDNGQDYLTVTGSAATVLTSLIKRLGLDSLFAIDPDAAGTVSNYRFNRYVDAWTGMRTMLKTIDRTLAVTFQDHGPMLSTRPIRHIGDEIDSDLMDIDIETVGNVNHMIGLGKGQLKARATAHWYMDAKGTASQTQSIKGAGEITRIYEDTNSEGTELSNATRDRLKESWQTPNITCTPHDGLEIDIDDEITAREHVTGNTVTATVTKATVKHALGVTSTTYETKTQ